MEKLKFVLFSIVALSLLGLVGYWSVITLQSGTEHAKDQKIKRLEKENEDLKIEVKKFSNENSILRSKLEKPVSGAEKAPEQTVYKYQDLISELQKLADKNVFLKLKSTGGDVGVVQKFLNIYNNVSNKVDNDYGESTKKAITDFQKDQKLVADGGAGSDTFSKMIDWLKEQK